MDGWFAHLLITLSAWLLFAACALGWTLLAPASAKRDRKKIVAKSAGLAIVAGAIAPAFPVSETYGAFSPFVAVIGAVVISFVGGHWVHSRERREEALRAKEQTIQNRLAEIEFELRQIKGVLESNTKEKPFL